MLVVQEVEPVVTDAGAESLLVAGSNCNHKHMQGHCCSGLLF